MMNNKFFLGAVFVAAIAVGGYFALGNRGADGVGPTLGAANAQSADVDVSAIQEMMLGDENAPITVVEYASYTCSYCKNFHDTTFKDLKADYIDTGKVKFIYREIYFDRYGLWGSIVARCGGAEKFFGISDMLYTQQREWTKGDAATVAANLQKIGLAAGLTQDAVSACFKDGENAKTLVAWFEQNAAQDGISSTPSFVINGTKYSNMAYSEFKTILEAQLSN